MENAKCCLRSKKHRKSCFVSAPTKFLRLIMSNVRTLWLIMLLLCVAETSSWAYLYVVPESMDDYVTRAESVLIVECVPDDEHIIYGNMIRRKVRIIEPLKGELKKEQTIHVLMGDDLIPSRIYMIFSGFPLNEKGELDAYSIKPGVVEVSLWGEVDESEKKKRLADFLETLKPMTLKEQLTSVLTQHFLSLKWRLLGIEEDRKRLGDMLSK